VNVADLIQRLTDHDSTSPVRVARADHDGPIGDETGASCVVAVHENGACWLVIRDEDDETPRYLAALLVTA
jgi:hypothetical protein